MGYSQTDHDGHSASLLQLRSHSRKHLTFTLSDEHYAIPLSAVKEVIAMTQITPVPHVAEYFKGLINLRGRVISVIDLRLKLGLHAPEYQPQKTSIVITDVNDLTIGNIVDDVTEVLGIDQADVERDLDISSVIRREFISGAAKPPGKPLILMLNIKRLLTADELQMLEASQKSSEEDSDDE